MKTSPMLEYSTPPPHRSRFWVGLLVGFLVAIAANIVPYLATYHAYDGDGFEMMGFPLTFREQGGLAYTYTFSNRALIIDIAFCLIVAARWWSCRVVLGKESPRLPSQPHKMSPPSSSQPVKKFC